MSSGSPARPNNIFTQTKGTKKCPEFVKSAVRDLRSAKYKGGIGLHTTGISKRRFLPNLQTVRTTDGKGNTKRVTICTRCLKAGKVVKA